jgi:hypothetical protein
MKRRPLVDMAYSRRDPRTLRSTATWTLPIAASVGSLPLPFPVVHRLDQTPSSGGRGLALRHPQGLAAYMPAFFAASGDDGTWLDTAFARKAAQQESDRADQLENENRRLRRQVAVVEKPREPSNRELALATGMAALNAFGALSTDTKARSEPKQSMAAAKREKQAAERADLEDFEARNAPWNVRRHWLHPDEYGPPSMAEYEQWGDVLGESRWDDEGDETMSEEPDGPAPTPAGKTVRDPKGRVREFIRREVEAAIAPPIPPPNASSIAAADAPAGGWSLGMKWTAAGIALVAAILAAVRYPLR